MLRLALACLFLVMATSSWAQELRRGATSDAAPMESLSLNFEKIRRSAAEAPPMESLSVNYEKIRPSAASDAVPMETLSLNFAKIPPSAQEDLDRALADPSFPRGGGDGVKGRMDYMRWARKYPDAARALEVDPALKEQALKDPKGLRKSMTQSRKRPGRAKVAEVDRAPGGQQAEGLVGEDGLRRRRLGAEESGGSSLRRPGEAAGLNPQPEPPRHGRLIRSTRPGEAAGLNPQPEPPRHGRLIRSTRPGEAVGLNPQPEPPSLGHGQRPAARAPATAVRRRKTAKGTRLGLPTRR